MPDKGLLQIGTFEKDFSKPLQNTSVEIKDSTGKIIDTLISDESGQTPTISLDAPPVEYSMEDVVFKPYSEYFLSVKISGVVKAVVDGVQVFSGTNAIQNIFIQPESDITSHITVPEPVLWGDYPAKIPEEDIKPIPPSKGFVVLPDPVVPEYVIVHAGSPQYKSAPNYWVPFKDYIKNVASCEIYSTWPETTIRANILAILSFTLNRIYTEWYTGKGYNFTITNTTTLDHAYSHGRTIFKEISVVVDEIFTSFITKAGIRQPLFTQYCDGKKSSCPGHMTQWGSKDLGIQGLSAIDILKRFYGQDIYLMQAKKVSGIPKSFSGTNLQTGSRGADVRTIQEQLNGISKNYPAIKKLRVDGIFGPATRESVLIFQKAFKLPETGIVNFATWYRISDIYVAVTKIAA